MSNNNRANSGIGFFGLLTLLFIGLKLANVINWSWWLVLIIPVLRISFVILFSTLALIYLFVMEDKQNDK